MTAPGVDPATAEPGRWLDVAHACCDMADEIALASFRTGLASRAKPDGSFVTEVDLEIERRVRERLREQFPEHGILGEEYGSAVEGTSASWILDPIDGTHNFMRGIPLFATLLAAQRDGLTEVAVISAPALGRRWFASRAGGAFAIDRDDDAPRRLHVSDEQELANSQLLYRAVTDMRASRVAAGFEALLSSVWRERGFGDFWGYALVAEGAAEAFVERDLGAWDLAAPWLLVEEAGGRVSDFDGARSFAKGESLATNGRLHDTILDRLWNPGDHDPLPPAR
jgi:histidinol-phosphatase